MLGSRLHLTPSLRRGLHSIIPPMPPAYASLANSTPLGLSHAMPFITRHLSSTSPINPKGSKWIRLVPVAAVVGATVFFLTSRSNKDVDDKFDTEKLYASKSTANIAFSWLILKMCSYDFLVNNGPRLLEWMNTYPYNQLIPVV